MTRTASATPLTGRQRWWLGLLLVASFALRAWCGSAGLDSSHNFDERFTLHNVKALLEREGFDPANAYYPSVSFLPQALLLGGVRLVQKATGVPGLAIYTADGESFSRLSYLLCRWLSALYGTLSIGLLFQLGRRLASPCVGLVAATLLAALPAHVTSSAQIKPDILVVLLVLLAFAWALTAVERLYARTSLDAVERHGRTAALARAYALAGAGIGLAVAAKYTGVGAALPLAAGTFLGGEAGGWRRSWRDRRRWGLLLLAGGASLVTFLVLNPHLPKVLSYLPQLAEIYERKGEQAGGSHLGVLRDEVRFLYRHHGPVLASGFFVALAVLLARARRGEPGLGQQADWGHLAMVLTWPLGYSLLYAAASTLFKGQNYLPVAAFTSLVLAWGLVELAAALARRAPWLARAPVRIAGIAVLLVLLFRLPFVEVYREVVPTTLERAGALLVSRLQPVERHQLFFERGTEMGPLLVTVGGSRAAMGVVPRLAEVEGLELDRADAEVFAATRAEGASTEGTGAEGPEAAFYRERTERAGTAAKVEIAGRWFVAHGPALTLLVHPWRLAGEPEPLALVPTGTGRRLRAPLAGSSNAPEVVSLLLELRSTGKAEGAARLRVQGRPVGLWLVQGRGQRGLYLTSRFELPAGTESLEIILPPSLDLDVVPGEEGTPKSPAQLCRWQPPTTSSEP